MIHRLQGVYKTREVLLDGKRLDIRASRKVINHSPAGFAWGYCGSGPAQLALAVCLKIFGKAKALELYQDFKWNVVSEIISYADFDVKFDEDTLQLLGSTEEVV